LGLGEEKALFRRYKPILIYTLRRANVVAVRHMWPGTRVGTGAIFMVGGVFGFLPILGFWMIPVGVFVAASEFPRSRRPMQRWLYREKKTLSPFERRHPKEASGMKN
jgi:hypothetical protein